MKDLIRRLQPDRFGDIVAPVALYRPGPLESGMVEDFVARKHTARDLDYPHRAQAHARSDLRRDRVPGTGHAVAQALPAPPRGADLLRRAMGKKKAEEMAKQRSVFVSGAGARRPRRQATRSST